MRRLGMHRFARIMAFIALLAAVALPVIAAAGWIFLDKLAELAVGSIGVYFEADTVGTTARFIGFMVAAAGACLQAFGLLGLRRMFLEAAKGRWLSMAAIAGFRRFAWVSVAMVLVGIVQQSAYSAILTMGHPTRPGELAVSLGSNEVKALFTALLLVFAVHVFTAGRRAEEENAAFL